MADLRAAENVELNPGICDNCMSASNCTHKDHAGRPVLFCEEYQCINGSCGEKNLSIDYSKYVVATPDTSHGLCCNCDYLSDCETNRELGTVLYCENYA